VTDLLGGQEMGQLWGGTFHSIGNRILRQQRRAGYQRDFTIMDREDAKHLITDMRGGIEYRCEGHAVSQGRGVGDIFRWR